MDFYFQEAMLRQHMNEAQERAARYHLLHEAAGSSAACLYRDLVQRLVQAVLRPGTIAFRASVWRPGA